MPSNRSKLALGLVLLLFWGLMVWVSVQDYDRLPGAPAAVPATRLALRQLLVSERGVTRVVRALDIAWIETADNYVVLHTAGGQPLLRQTLAGLLGRLGPGFMRCHRQAAVQLAWIGADGTAVAGSASQLALWLVPAPCQ